MQILVAYRDEDKTPEVFKADEFGIAEGFLMLKVSEQGSAMTMLISTDIIDRVFVRDAQEGDAQIEPPTGDD